MKSDRYIAIFAPGFEAAMATLLPECLPGVDRIRVFPGMVRFLYAGPPANAASVPFFNNVFFVFQEWETSSIPFGALVRKTPGNDALSGSWSRVRTRAVRTFRVRFSASNKFCSVDRQVMETAERLISSSTGLTPNRLEPDAEFWYLTRSEGYSCLAYRLPGRPSSTKDLRQGELRPEIAQLLVALAAIPPEAAILLDPFAGYGSIPEALARRFPSAVVHAGDIDPERQEDLRTRFGNSRRIVLHPCGVSELTGLEGGSVDAVVTDPPWGMWEGERYSGERSIPALYRQMLEVFAGLLKSGGRLCVLTGAKREFEEAVARSTVFAEAAKNPGFRTDILVNGKKSAAYILDRP